MSKGRLCFLPSKTLKILIQLNKRIIVDKVEKLIFVTFWATIFDLYAHMIPFKIMSFIASKWRILLP